MDIVNKPLKNKIDGEHIGVKWLAAEGTSFL